MNGEPNVTPGDQGGADHTLGVAVPSAQLATSAESASAAAPTLAPPPVKTYTSRFAIIYTLLGIALAGAVIGLIVLVVKPGATAAPNWSTWKPSGGTVAAQTKQIADHLASTYRLSEGGGQLVAVIPSGPTITSGTSNIAIKAIAVRKAPQSNAGLRIIDDTSNTRVFTLCGLGQNCSIEGGTATATRGRLVRREALEVALYTFKFVPAVDSVLTFMPPPPGETTASVLFLEKGDVKQQLSQPLNKTLPLRTPPLPNDEDLAEAATIDKLTLKNLFTYELQALQTGGAAMVLDPAA